MKNLRLNTRLLGGFAFVIACLGAFGVGTVAGLQRIEEPRHRIGGVGAGVDLAVDGGDHVGVAVAQRGHGRAAAGIDVFVALGVAQQHALGGGDKGRGLA